MKSHGLTPFTGALAAQAMNLNQQDEHSRSFLHHEMITQPTARHRQKPNSVNGFKASLILVLAAGILCGRAAASETNTFANIRRPIPDGDSAGIKDVRTVVSDIVHLTAIQVRLKVAGNFNGDLYGFLSHRGGLTVLLNRPGRTATSPFGYDDCGLDVTFSDAAANDIHTYRLSTPPPAGSPLTGTWQPDARYTDPAAVLDTSLRSTFLSEFSGLNASGDWVLFLADMDAGGTNMLVSWGLELTGTPKIAPSLAWATPAAVSYGTALGAAQLNATADVPGSFDYSPPAGTVLDVGNGWSLSVTFVPNDTNEYAVATATVLLDVLPHPLTVTADDQSRAYGAANPLFTGSLAGLQNGDNIIASYTTPAAPDSPVGSYAIVPALADPSGRLANYSVSINPGTLQVVPALLTVTAEDLDRSYGALNPPLTWQVSGFVNGQTQTAVLSGSPGLGTAATPTSPAGDYPITPTPGSLSATNYTFAWVDGTLRVMPAPLTGRANDQRRCYGETNPVYTVTYRGFVNGEDASIVTGSLSGSSPAQTNSPVGVYPIQVWGQSAPNYHIGYEEGSLTVAPAPLVVQANDASRAYGQTNPTFIATLSGLVNNEDITALAGTLAFTTPAQTNSPAGSYPIEPEGLSSTNYSLVFSNGTLTVRPYALVVSPDNQTRSYGAPNPGLTGTLAGVQNGDNITASFSTLADQSSPAGSYPITASLSDPDNKLPNYSVSTNQGTLTVAPAALVVSSDNQTRSYGAPNPGLTGTLVGLQNGDNLTASFSTPAGAVSPVGDYPIDIGLLDPDNKLGDYNVTTNVGVLTVTPAELVGRADDQVRLYGAPNPVFTITYSGFVNGEDASVVSGTLGSQTPAQTNSPAGVYPIQVWGQSAPNYDIHFVPGSLTVAPAPLVVQANDASRVWGQTNPVFSATFHGFSNGEGREALAGTLVFSTPADTNSAVGSYPIEPSGLSATNYSLLYSNGTLRVCEFGLVVSVDNQARSYGSANPPLTGSLTGLQAGDNITANYATAAETNSPVGSYPITVSWEDPDNRLSQYSVTTNQGSLTVTPAALVVSAEDQSRSYGAPNSGLTGSITGLQNGDNITASFATAADTNAPPGTYAIGPMLSDPDQKLGNYLVTTNQGILTVNPAALVVSADNQARPYGAPNPDLTGSINGLQNGDKIAPTYATLTEATTPVGAYPITVGLSDPDSKLSNYLVSTNNGSLTIDPAPLAVSADNQARTYGAPNPALTGSISGLQNGDNITANFATGADASSPAGDYPIIISLSDPDNKLSNYSVTTHSGTLSVMPAVLTGRADDQFRFYGQTNPPFSVTYRGFVSGEDARIVSGALTVACLAQTNSPAGVYSIEAGGQSAPNYRIEYEPGNLTVGPAPLVVQANDASRAYGQANPAFTASMSGFVNGEDLSGLGGELIFTTPAQTNSPVGSYPIEPGGLSATNYSLLYSNGTLRITQDALAVTPDNQVRSYGTANPVLTGTLAGLLEGDNIAASYSTLADATSPVGNYPITASLSDPDGKLANYSVSTNVGTLTVAPAALVVTADDLVRSYGATNPPLTGTVVGARNGDNITAGFSTPADASSPAGSYPIIASLSDPDGRLSNYSVTTNNGTLTVAPAALAVSADNQTRSYGLPNPVLTGTLVGLQNGDNITAQFSTLAEAGSPAAQYPITVGLSDPDGKLGNYNVTTNLGTLTINQAATVGSIVSSANPALLHSWVTFTLQFDAARPGTGIPTGTVQLLLDEVPYGSPLTPTEGNAELGTDALPLGAHAISAWYQGDENFLGVTVALASPQVIYTPPVAGAYTIRRASNQGTRVSVSDLLAASSDPGGYALGFDSAASTSAQGGTVRSADGWLFYEPPAGLTNADSFTYTVRDPYGASAPGLVSIQVDNQAAPTLRPTGSCKGTNYLLLCGIPWRAYTIEYSGNLTNATWQPLVTAMADSRGQFECADALPRGTPMRFYRCFGEGSASQNAVVLLLTSSCNPALPGAAVTFTASVLAADPGLGIPSGSVQFSSATGPLGPPAALVEGVASVTTSSLALGLPTVTVEYGGDDRFLTNAATLEPPQVVNTPPVAAADVVQRPPTDGTKIAASDLLANDSDPDGDPLYVESVAPLSDEGGRLSLANDWIYYTPPAGFSGVDSFTYTIRDPYDATAVGTATVEPLLSSGPSQSVTFLNVSNGTYRLIFTGIPWRTYTIQYTEDPASANWLSLGTATADSWGRYQFDDAPPPGAQPRFYRAVSAFAGPTASPFRLAVWTNFIAHTNGRTMEIWSERSLPDGWPNVQPVLAWNTNSLLYGLDGFTAISQCNEFQGSPGQVPATLLTRRHAYLRGHGLGDAGLTTGLAGRRVWFCTADNTVVTMTIAAEMIRFGTLAGEYYDYGLVVFTEDVPATLTPMSVLSAANVETYYSATPDLPFLFYGTEQQGHVSAQVPPFVYPLMKGGDSGSPNMIPTPDNVLVMISGRSTSGPSLQMQADLDALSAYLGLNTNNYQLRWYNMRPWGP